MKLLLLKARLSRLLKGNSLPTWVSLLAKAVPLFVLPPFVFAKFSSHEVAIWFIFITLQGMQLLIAASMGQTLVRSFAYAFGGATQVVDMRDTARADNMTPNRELLQRVWSTSSQLCVLSAAITFVLLSVIGIWSVTPLVSDVLDPVSAWAALAVFVLGSSLRAYGALHYSYLLGVGRIAVLRWWEGLFFLVSFIAALVTLLSGGGILATAIAYQVPLSVNLLWNVRFCRSDGHLQRSSISKLVVDWAMVAQLWPSVWRTGLGTVMYSVATQGAGLFYATVGSPEDVAIYLFLTSLIRPLGQFAQVPFLTRVPLLAQLQVRGAREQQVAIARRAMLQCYVLHALMVVVFALATYSPIAFLGNAFSVPTELWLLIGLAGYVERVGSMHLQLYSSTSVVLVHWANGLSAALYLMIVAILLPILGVLSFPVSQILALSLGYLPLAMTSSYRSFLLSFPMYELQTSFFPGLIILAVLGFALT
jgi:hypothetical protein